jgi:hypothetical protein
MAVRSFAAQEPNECGRFPRICRARAIRTLAIAGFFLGVALLASPGPANAQTTWLCRPGLPDNPCESSRTATVITADGDTSIEQSATGDQPIDCFYVYPTVSSQPSGPT